MACFHLQIYELEEKQFYQNLLPNLILKIFDLFFFWDPRKIEIIILFFLNYEILVVYLYLAIHWRM